MEHNLISFWSTSIIRGVLHGTIVMALVWIILRLFPKIYPTFRCWLWRIAYLKFLISVLGMGMVQIPWLSFQTSAPVTQWIPATPNMVNSPTDLYLFYRYKFWFFIWIAGVGLFAFYLAYLWYRNLITRKDNYPVNQPVLEKLYTDFCAELKIGRPPKLRLSDSITSPSLQGLIFPEIILPATILAEYPPEEIKLMLAHELAHFTRGDLWWNWLPVMVRWLFFFHPLVWLAERQWKESLEICSDRQAVEFSGARNVDYGKVLVKATVQPAPNLKNSLKQWCAANFYIPGSKLTLFNRLKALDIPNRPHPKWALLSLLAVILFGLAVILPWQLFPSIFFSVKYNVGYRTFNTLGFMEKDNLTIIGAISDTDNIYIQDFEVFIDNQKITEGFSPNSYGKSSAMNFEGYLLIKNSFDPKQSHQVKVLVHTTAGDFQGKYVVNFSEKDLWANRSL